MYTYKRLPYIILNNADDALVLEELFAADVIPTFTACDLATQGSSSSGFWALCAPLLKSLDVKKNTGVSLDQVNAGLIRDNHLLLLYIIIFSSID